MLVDQHKITEYYNDSDSWDFHHKFDPPINIQQALIIYGLFIWQGNNGGYDTYLHHRFHLALLRIQRHLSDIIDLTKLFNLEAATHADITNSHSELFDEKVNEKFMSFGAIFDAYGSSDDGYFIGLDLSIGRLDSAKFAADVVALFSSNDNRLRLTEQLLSCLDVADHDLYRHIKLELKDGLLAQGVTGDE